MTIEVEGIGDDDDGNEIYVTTELTRKEFEKLIKPLVDRTIELTKETIEESGVKQSTIHKVVLVGGPTQIPYIKDRLNREFTITVDSSVDPLTVVARGAAIFATSQRIPKEFTKQEKKDCKEAGLNLPKKLDVSFSLTEFANTTPAEHAAFTAADFFADPEEPFIFPEAAPGACYGVEDDVDMQITEAKDKDFSNAGNGVFGGKITLKRVVVTP